MGKIIVSAADLARIVDRIAHQILEKTDGARDTVLLGIPTRGVPLARRLADRIHAFEGIDGPGRRARRHALPRRPAAARRPRARADRPAARRASTAGG